MKDTMTPRERWQAVLDRKTPDRIPLDFWGTQETGEKLVKHLGAASLEDALERLHVDRTVILGPIYVGPKRPEGVDEFGCRALLMDYGMGVYYEAANHPLAEYDSVAEIEANYTWPSPDWYSYAHLPEVVEQSRHLPINAGACEAFHCYCRLRGQEQAMVDLALDPDIVHYCLDKIFEIGYQRLLRAFEAVPGKALMAGVHEDLGSQKALLFSLDHFRTFLKPGMKRLADLVHSAGAYVFHHDDGAIREVIPDLIDLGIDILNPVQWRCPGMEREGLKRDFGDKVVFLGGVDNQYTLAFGTTEEVRQEVRDNIDILGAGGGYILAPCHSIQSISPPENVVAMFEEGFAYGS